MDDVSPRSQSPATVSSLILLAEEVGTIIALLLQPSARIEQVFAGMTPAEAQVVVSKVRTSAHALSGVATRLNLIAKRDASPPLTLPKRSSVAPTRSPTLPPPLPPPTTPPKAAVAQRPFRDIRPVRPVVPPKPVPVIPTHQAARVVVGNEKTVSFFGATGRLQMKPMRLEEYRALEARGLLKHQREGKEKPAHLAEWERAEEALRESISQPAS